MVSLTESLDHMNSTSIVSLLLSLAVITAVAFLSEITSPFVGSILATAPTGTSLALFLASQSSTGSSAATQERLISATEGLVHGTISTLCFAILARTSAVSGNSLGPTLLAGFVGWSGSLLLLRQFS